MDQVFKQLFEIEEVTDIFINGPRNVMIDRGSGLEKIALEHGILPDPASVRALAQKYAFMAGERLDDACPIIDGKLPNGSRLSAILSPICPKESGAIISLRVPSKNFLTLETLINQQVLSKKQSKLILEHVHKKSNIIISGATGSGKTTLLSALVSEIDATQRLICIEEAREISEALHSGLIFMTAKKPNIEGRGEVTLSQLLKTSLRMRPDRILIGECRGSEIVEYLHILNTGHNGTITTIHANSVDEIDLRLSSLSTSEINPQLLKCIDLKIHIERSADGKRRVTEVRA